MQRWWKVRETQRLKTIKIHHCDNILTWVTMTWAELWERKWRAGYMYRASKILTDNRFLSEAVRQIWKKWRKRKIDRNVEKGWSTVPTRQGKATHTNMNMHFELSTFVLNLKCHLCIMLIFVFTFSQMGFSLKKWSSL